MAVAEQVEREAELRPDQAPKVNVTGIEETVTRMPDGYRISPHWHPKRENVTVISGNFKVGMGDGSLAYLDPGMHH
jgi:hypothetical protein